MGRPQEPAPDHRRQVADALLGLHTRSTRFIAASLLESVAVSIRINRTRRRLQIVT
jgi:hypothetical protein